MALYVTEKVSKSKQRRKEKRESKKNSQEQNGKEENGQNRHCDIEASMHPLLYQQVLVVLLQM